MLLGSLAFHALLALLFVVDLARKPVPEGARPMSVWLEPPTPPPQPASSSSRSDGKAARVSARTATEPSVVVPSIPALPAGRSPSPALVPGAAEAFPDLRGLGGGCRLSGLDRLPPEARARCQERLAQAMTEGKAPRPNFDPTGRYARDARPYLTRPPKNGCKPVAAVKDEIMGQTSATIGVGCAWSF